MLDEVFKVSLEEGSVLTTCDICSLYMEGNLGGEGRDVVVVVLD
jgi:hypothetical protein